MAYDIIIGRNAKDREEYGTEGTIFLGKTFVKMGRNTSLSNRLLLDVIRSHVIFVCGKRGGGKCLGRGTLITLHDGSRVPIEELAKDGKDVVTLNQELKIQTAPKTEFYERTVDTLLKIRLRSGKEIELTPEHPLLTVKGWIPANKLGLGSRIATPRTLPDFGENVLEESRIKLLAYLIAEGSLTQRMTKFSNTDADMISDFSAAVESFDPALCTKPARQGTYLVVKKCRGPGANSLAQYLRSVGLARKNSYTKFIPNEIFTTTKANISLFLNRLFSCDGTIYYDKNRRSWRISYASCSKKLIIDVHSLLLKFSILSKVRSKLTRCNRKKFLSYELEVQASHIPVFIQEIGFFGKKIERQRQALKEVPNIRNANVDTIPIEVWQDYKPKNWAKIGRAMDYAHPKAMRERIRYAPSRQTLLQIALADEQEQMQLLAISDIFWDEIVDVKLLSGSFPVYDLTVPGTHNFVANDIIVHNSYTMGVIAEGVADLPPSVKNNISIIMLDTMGVYWTMKYPNKKDELLLNEWGLEPKPLDIVIYTPKGYFQEYKDKGIPTDYPFSVRPSELDGKDWCMTFGISSNEPIGVLIQKVVNNLREEKTAYDMDAITTSLQEQKAEVNVINAALNLFENAKTWGLFDKEGTSINDLAKGGQVAVLDVSCYATMPGGWEIKSLVIGLVAQKLFIQRMISRKNEEYQQVHKSAYYFSEEEIEKLDFPMVWLVIDEAHEFLPREGKTLATDPLVTIMREGRQPGISVIFATQQPGKIHTDVMTQSDTIISHRITSKLDTDALGALMQSYLRSGLDKYLDDLPRVKGAAIVLDDSNEKMFPMRVRPRFTWHGGEAPSAIMKKDKIFD
ncbi:hypothetical protein JW826_02260 [Candidatus Woesearchaeota archaeon]|nr:hypothetical protein [Candidatus Woesearchaeota archaeon]